MCGRMMRSLLQLSQRWPCHKFASLEANLGWDGAFKSGRNLSVLMLTSGPGPTFCLVCRESKLFANDISR